MLFQIECSTHLLKGYALEASDNRLLAAESFRAAIQADPLCYEAVHALTQHHMLTYQEGNNFIINDWLILILFQFILNINLYSSNV